MKNGLRKTYKKGHQAAKIALRKPTTPHLHEWRKQTKYLRYQLELLRPPLLKTLRRQCKKLAQRLGDDHDLAMLSQWIAGTHIISRKDSRRLLPRIRRRRREIQKDALRLGKAAYDKKPSKLFIDWP